MPPTKQPRRIRFAVLGAVSGVAGAALVGLGVWAVLIGMPVIISLLAGDLSLGDLGGFFGLGLVAVLLGTTVGGGPAGVVGAVLGLWLQERPIGRREFVVIGLSGVAVTVAAIGVATAGQAVSDLVLIVLLAPVGIIAACISAAIYMWLTRRFR